MSYGEEWCTQCTSSFCAVDFRALYESWENSSKYIYEFMHYRLLLAETSCIEREWETERQPNEMSQNTTNEHKHIYAQEHRRHTSVIIIQWRSQPVETRKLAIPMHLLTFVLVAFGQYIPVRFESAVALTWKSFGSGIANMYHGKYVRGIA